MVAGLSFLNRQGCLTKRQPPVKHNQLTPQSLFSLGSFNRANLCAISALNASRSIDLVFTVTLADAFYRALRSTCAAGNAIV
jgi:hypothetical protein